jgi:hypothetical protein
MSEAAPEIVIAQLGGNCPVQAEGTINGKPFYFRARGEAWSLGIGGADPCGEAEWEHSEWFGEWPDAGWMTPEQAEGFLRQAAARYANGQPGGSLADDPGRLTERAARFRERYGIPTPPPPTTAPETPHPPRHPPRPA